MSWFLVLPLFIGMVTVLQGVLNRNMSPTLGLGGAVLLNSAIALVLSAVLYAIARNKPGFLPPIFDGQLSFEKLSWWMVFPGMFGMCIIAGIPWGISKLGAGKVFVGIVVAQVVTSMLLDMFMGAKPLTAVRVLGAFLAIVGVVLVSLDR